MRGTSSTLFTASEPGGVGRHRVDFGGHRTTSHSRSRCETVSFNHVPANASLMAGDGGVDIGSDPVYEDVAGGDWAIKDGSARRFVERATSTVASLVRTTLGPRGMEKLIRTRTPHQRPEIVQTSDAGEILAAIERGDGFNHPVAAMFVDAVDSMQRGLGDGTTTALVLAAELIERGVDLVEEGLHPGTVVVGYAMAANRAGQTLDDLSREIGTDDRERLRQVAATTMTADLDPIVRARYAGHVTDAIERLAVGNEDGFLDTDDVSVLTGHDVDGGIVDGVVVQRRPTALHESEEAISEFDWTPAVEGRIEDVTVALVEKEIDFEASATSFNREGSGTGVTIERVDQLVEYRSGFEGRIRAEAERLRDMGVSVLVCPEKIADTVRDGFERVGIAVIDEATYPESEVFRLARATGGRVVSRVQDVTEDDLGVAGTLEERRVGEEKWAFFGECDGPVSSIVLDPPLETDAARHERAVEDALEATSMAVMDDQVIPGAGAPAIAIAADLRDYAPSIPDREQLAVDAFAAALEQLPAELARSAGLDPADAVIELRASHAAAERSPAPIGLDLDSGDPADAWELGVVEPRRVFSQAIETAVAATERLLTVDGVLFPGVDFRTVDLQTERG